MNRRVLTKLLAITVGVSMLIIPSLAIAQIDINPSLKKLELGIKNLTISGISVEEGAGERLAEQPQPFLDSAVEGIIKGVFLLPGRILVGLLQVLTFPFTWRNDPLANIDLSSPRLVSAPPPPTGMAPEDPPSMAPEGPRSDDVK